MAQGSKCTNLGTVELRIKIREFSKLWNFQVIAEMQYPFILSIDFMSHAKISVDFSTESLIIPDSQIEKVAIPVEPVEIDLSKTKLGTGKKEELHVLFNEFRSLFSSKPGLTHVLYHGIDTGEYPPVSSWAYRYDRIKQGAIDYVKRVS